MRHIKTIWTPRGAPFDASFYDRQTKFPPILEHLVRQRVSLSALDLEQYLHPKLRNLSDPFLMPDMQAAVNRILQAIDRGENICIYGDYDVDGITSITLMRKVLVAYGAEPRSFIPCRGKEGYGLSFAAIERCLTEGVKPDLLITVDCGTSSVDEIASLKSQGIDVLVVDHHEPSETRPACVALVNPKCSDALTYLCAAGVVFKLAHALLKTRQVPSFDLKNLLDLVAVATVSDMVPLIEENRLFVRHGLTYLAKTTNFGLRALQEIAGVKHEISSSDVGFRIGPRINAAGRMDFPEDALLALNTEDAAEAKSLVLRLNGYNQERQSHEQHIRDQAVLLLNQGFDPEKDPVIVLSSREWHHGVVGIVASRLMRQYHKPTFVISIDENGIGKGSGRSIDGVSLVDAIRASSDHLISGGGHAMAAGISVREEHIDAFRQHFAQFVESSCSEEQRQPKLMYDAELDFSQLSLDFLNSYELLQPFGNNNPQPVFISRRVALAEDVKVMKNHHLRLHLEQEGDFADAVFFGGGEHPLPELPWDIAFSIDKNVFRGNTTLQLVIQQIRHTETP